MFIITGGTGHTGGAVARELLRQKREVTIISRNDSQRAEWKEQGASYSVADIHDVAKLNQLFKQGHRAFLLNPPASKDTDTDKAETDTAHCLVKALDHSGLEMVVAQSTYGAQPGERLGDLSVLYALEEGLRAQAIPAVIMRAAYLMSNWQPQLAAIKETGILETMMPEDLELPMVAPEDLGLEGARQLTEPPATETKVIYVEGPARYRVHDVAEAFSQELNRAVQIKVIPPEEWINAFRQQGFSEPAAESYARMTRISIDGIHKPSNSLRGTTTLESYIKSIVHQP